jgi:hypothetical protein
VSRVRYELGFYIPEDGTLHSRRRENLKTYISFPIVWLEIPALRASVLKVCSILSDTLHPCVTFPYSITPLF